ncbi:thiopeptide-type bacteriocin biosynthesis protein [Streptomyces sp. NPDC059851]|uniref:thiopeptide-type bacteriocin biosynthesis protein n=1 Tax=Streptomyces sp. NPDC059851 TaxID=3346971 RepID=UPI00365F531D
MTTDTWHSLHLFLHSGTEDTDRFLVREAAPLLDRLTGPGGSATRWFFIRYGEDGPHVRIRVRGLGAPVAADLAQQLARAAKEVPAVPGPWPSGHGEVREVPYVPETARYGGPQALPVAEEVFAASTQVALDALRALHGRGGRDTGAGAGAGADVGAGAAVRLALAADLAHATAYALGMGRLTTARWLRRHAAGWRWVTEVPLLPGASVHARVNSVYAAQRTGLARRAAGVREHLAAGTAPGWLGRWADAVGEADALLRAGSTPAGNTREEAQDTAPDATAWIWASQLHMLFNRLGITPDEERAVCRLAARTLLETEEPPGFFPQGHTAADVQYLERSKFQIGRGEDTALRSLPAPRRSAAGPELDLPADPLPQVPLGAVLADRSSLRGALAGPLDARALGSLLWHSLCENSRSEQTLADGTARTLVHRAYPSAGALYTARVRLLVLDVAGVPAGTYDCVPERRTLHRIGPVPELDRIKALSTYLSRPSTDPDWIGIDGAPAVLAVYADLGVLRRRYGLRALRLALLETGHLAQTLLLTASVLGLGGTPLGGFHDDLAHELLGLDDLEQPLQYLLPLGRRPTSRDR